MNTLSHPWSRALGVVAAAMIVFFLDTQSISALHRLILPLGLAVAAWLMTRSLMAVAFATFTMAAISTRWSAESWIPSIAYPTVAAIALLVCLTVITQRFRERIAQTHEERWARRRQQTDQQDGAAANTSDTARKTDGHTHE